MFSLYVFKSEVALLSNHINNCHFYYSVYRTNSGGKEGNDKIEMRGGGGGNTTQSTLKAEKEVLIGTGIESYPSPISHMAPPTKDTIT